jgi:hypothetical protein
MVFKIRFFSIDLFLFLLFVLILNFYWASILYNILWLCRYFNSVYICHFNFFVIVIIIIRFNIYN